MDIVEFLKTELNIDGKEAPSGWYRACCPIHGESSPSFAVLTEPPYPFKCLSCGAGGQLPYLTARVLNISIAKATELIRDRIRVDISVDKLFRDRPNAAPISEPILKAYQDALTSSQTMRYCAARGVPKFILTLFGVGHDTMNYQMVIPLRDLITGEVVGFDTRGFIPGEEPEKSSSIPTGYKGRVAALGQGWVKENIVVVEGFFDAAKVAMFLLREGMWETTAVAAFGGTSLSKEQLMFLSGYDRIIVGYDADAAGERAALRLRSSIGDIPLYRLRFEGADPGESPVDSFSVEGFI